MVSRTATLSKAQAAALPFIHSAAAQGITKAETMRQLQSAGIGVRKEWLLAQHDSFTSAIKSGYHIQNVRHDYFPTPSKIDLSATNMKDKYGLNVQVGIIPGEYQEDGVTPRIKSVWVTDNELHPTQWYLDQAHEYVDTADEMSSYRPSENFEEIDEYKVLEAIQRNPIFGRG